MYTHPARVENVPIKQTDPTASLITIQGLPSKTIQTQYCRAHSPSLFLGRTTSQTQLSSAKMHSSIFSVAAATLLSLASVAYAQEPEDCRTSAYANWANVTCYYDFDTGGNFLNYVIQIPPTGQDPDGWCEGIMANIKGECGGYADNIEVFTCNKYMTQVLEFPNGQEASGIDYNFHWNWDWFTGDDETACVRKAIQDATCAATVWFPSGGCYKRS